nr:MAG TPA: hypothetical protein [Caudoviricetes sp.]
MGHVAVKGTGNIKNDGGGENGDCRVRLGFWFAHHKKHLRT